MKQFCELFRKECKELEEKVRALREFEDFKHDQAYPYQHSEMLANIMLAVRHLEDARMRLGKVIQYSGNGVSIYDKAPTTINQEVK
jgi:exonuclease VII small subunit